jgi:GNAT superfamily N-acetyltransferase
VTTEGHGLAATTFTARLYREEDEASFHEMLQAAFGGWPRFEIRCAAIDHLRWKLRSHPMSMPHHVVAEAGGRIVGGNTTIVKPLRAGARTLLSRATWDIAVHPEYRQLGVFAAMRRVRESLDKDFDLMMGGMGRNPAVLRLRERIPQERVRFANEVVLLRVEGDAPASVVAPADVNIEPVTTFDQRFDDLWAQAVADFDFTVVRDSRYLNWRYGDPRAGCFTTWAAVEAGTVIGFVVQRVSHGRGYIADLLARPRRVDVVGALVGHALENLRDQGVSRVEAWSTAHHFYNVALMDCGFVAAKRPVAIDYRALRVPADTLDVLRDPHGRVHVAIGDTDLV